MIRLAGNMADDLPGNFMPSEANTVSADESEIPIYIFFEEENDAGTLDMWTHAKTEGFTVK